jgi:hypothetical protein
MPKCELQNTKPVGGYKEVCIIGNGPSGLCLSYFLSGMCLYYFVQDLITNFIFMSQGHWPYWNKTKVSDEYLQIRLESCDNGLSLVEQDLEYLSDGLEGRSNNPVALLYDKLKHPDGDLGIDSPSCLNWVYDPLKEIDHVCIGKAAGPGGAWNDLDGSSLTISPSRWMELPDMSYTDWKRQTKVLPNMNAGLIFSAKNSNFAEDNSLLNGNSTSKTNHTNKSFYFKQLSTEESRASMHDVRNYYRDYAKQKNIDKYLLNNATVTNVRRVTCNKFFNCDSQTGSQLLWEVSGLIDKRDRKKASSLSHKGDLMEFKYFCKHLVLANGATDLHNELKVKGENLRYVLKSIRELEDKIKDDLPRLQKDPLLVVGSGLSAADAILLAQKHHIRIIHVIRRSVNDSNLVFNKLPKKVYPEYQRVYETMIHNRYTNIDLTSDDTNNNVSANTSINSNNNSQRSYILYDEHSIKYFSSKRTVLLSNLKKQTCHQVPQHSDKHLKCLSRHLHLQNKSHHHQHHLNELKEECETQQLSQNNNCFKCVENDTSLMNYKSSMPLTVSNDDQTEIKISYACVLIGFAPDLDFLPEEMVNELALDASKRMNLKDNPVGINPFTHESMKFKNLYAMGPLVGDNFVRFGTGGALAIFACIYRQKKNEKQGGSMTPTAITKALSKNSLNNSSVTNLNNITDGLTV